MSGEMPGGVQGQVPGGGEAREEMPGEMACYPEDYTLTSTYSGI